jgi:hypothetical protein
MDRQGKAKKCILQLFVDTLPKTVSPSPTLFMYMNSPVLVPEVEIPYYCFCFSIHNAKPFGQLVY